MPANDEIGPDALHKAIERVISTIAERHRTTPELCLACVANGGLEFGRRIATGLSERLDKDIRIGTVNIIFHRDDIALNPIPKNLIRTDLPFEVEDATIILVDDVLCSGRTARAALNEIFDQGRPERVELAVLCDRGNRRLPVHADYVGLSIDTVPSQIVSIALSATDPDEDCLCIDRNVPVTRS